VGLIAIFQASVFPPLAIFSLFAVYYVFRPQPRGKEVNTEEERLEDAQIKQYIQRAIEAKRRKDQLQAGWLYERGNQWIRAAECFEAGGDGIWAAELYLRGGNHSQAGEMYRLYGYPREAAETFEAGGVLGHAGVCYEIAGDLPRAANLFQRADRPDRAAELYLRMGMHHQAGQLFEAAGDMGHAADAYERMIDQLGRKNFEANLGIARVLEEEGRIESTIRFYEGVGEVMQALFAAMRHSRDEDAIRIYKEYREILAGPLLRGAESGKLSPDIMANLFERANDSVPAARMAVKIGDQPRAARLFEDAQMDIQAGEAWEEAGETREAALAYERADAFHRAAPLFVACEDKLRAVHCFRQAEDHWGAGSLYEELGETDNAISSYQKVDAHNEHRPEARRRLARLLAGRERWDLAIDIYEELLGPRPSDVEDIDDIGSLARCLEARERFGEAAACWMTIARLEAAREGVEEAYTRLRDLAERADQTVPQTYPHRPEQPSAAPPMPGMADGMGMGGGGLPMDPAAQGMGSGGLSGGAMAGLGGGAMPNAPGIEAAPDATETLPASGGVQQPPQPAGGGFVHEASLPSDVTAGDAPSFQPAWERGADSPPAASDDEAEAETDETEAMVSFEAFSGGGSSDTFVGMDGSPSLPDGVGSDALSRFPGGDEPVGPELGTGVGDAQSQSLQQGPKLDGIDAAAGSETPGPFADADRPDSFVGDPGAASASTTMRSPDAVTTLSMKAEERTPAGIPNGTSPDEMPTFGLEPPPAVEMPTYSLDPPTAPAQSQGLAPPSEVTPTYGGGIGTEPPQMPPSEVTPTYGGGIGTEPPQMPPSEVTPTYGGGIAAEPPQAPPPSEPEPTPTYLSDQPDPGAAAAAGVLGAQAAAIDPLSMFSFFGDLNQDERPQLQGFMDYYSFEPGESVLDGDEDEDGLVLLTKGEVEIIDATGRRFILAAVSYFAEEMLLRGDLPSMRASARTPSECWILSREGARRLAEQDRPLAVKLARALRAAANAR